MRRRPNVNHTQLRDGLARVTISKGGFVQGMQYPKKFGGGRIDRGRIEIAPSWRPIPPPACPPKEKGIGTNSRGCRRGISSLHS